MQPNLLWKELEKSLYVRVFIFILIWQEDEWMFMGFWCVLGIIFLPSFPLCNSSHNRNTNLQQSYRDEKKGFRFRFWRKACHIKCCRTKMYLKLCFIMRIFFSYSAFLKMYLKLCLIMRIFFFLYSAFLHWAEYADILQIYIFPRYETFLS